ncbi:hypothetical protein ACLKA7_013136 [Drosophila subpalustris]
MDAVQQRTSQEVQMSHNTGPSIQPWLICPVVESDEETEQVLRYIKFVEKITRFKAFVTFFGNQSLGSRSVISKSLQQRMMDTFCRPAIVAGSEIGDLNRIVNADTLALVIFNGLKDPVLKELLSMPDSLMFVFIYQSERKEPLNSTQITEFFDWCFKRRFFKSLIIFKQDNTYKAWSYRYVTSVIIHQLTDDFLKNMNRQNYHEFLQVRNYRWLVTMYERIPEAFLYNSTDQKDLTGGHVSLGGVNGFVLTTFLRYVNGKMDILSFANRSDLELNGQRLAGNRTVDIGANLIQNHSVALYSGIAKMSRACLVVPSADRLPLSRYYSYSFKGSLRMFTVFIYLANVVIKRLTYPHKSLGSILFTSLMIISTQEMDNRAFRHLRLPDRFIHLSTTVFNLLIGSIICGTLITALNLGYYKQEIVDEQTFLNSGLQVMISDNDQLRLFENNEFPNILVDRLLIVDKRTQERHFFGLNRSYAYFVESDHLLLISHMQKRLTRPKLRMASNKLCTVNHNYRFQVRPELPAVSVLNSFLDRAHESGLLWQWIATALFHVQQMGLVTQAPYEPSERFPLPLSYFKGLLTTCAVLILTSLLVFVLEFAYANWTKRRNRLQRDRINHHVI